MSVLDTAEYRRLALLAAGVDPSQIPAILDTATWRRLMLAALYDLSQGGGGSPGYVNGSVQFYADLPVTVGTPPVNTAYLVREDSGVWFINRKPAGIYVRLFNNGTLADWDYAGEFPSVNDSQYFRIYDTADPTREIAFSAASIGTGQTRTVTVPNKNITLDDASDPRTPTAHTHAASAITSGTFDNARINFAAPPAIGNTTPSSGAFTTLTANNGTLTASAPAGTFSQTWNASGTTFTGLSLAITNTASASASAYLSFALDGTQAFSIRRGETTASATVITCGGAGGLTWTARTRTGGGVGVNFSGVVGVGSNLQFGTGTSTTSGDITISREAANILAQSNGLNAQEFRLYNTFTSATNHERLRLAWASNVAILGTEKGSGGGTARALEIRTDNVARINIGAAGQIGFFGAAAAAQPAAVADATDAASTQARLNDLLARLRTLGLIAT